MSGGTKHDNGKEPLDLIPYDSLKEIAKVLDFGQSKYEAFNWVKGFEYRRLIAAALRHINQFNNGEDKDAESGLSHIAHASCCLMFLLWMEKHRPDLDNRGFKSKETQ